MSAWGIVNSVIKYKDARRFPVSPGIAGQVLQIIAVASLTIGRILFITLCLNNSPYFHPVGSILQLGCIYLFNRCILKRPASIETTVLPSLLPAFYKPEKIEPTDSWVVRKLKSYGGIFITIIYESLTILIFSVLRYVIPYVIQSPKELENKESSKSVSQTILKMVFQRYMKEYKIVVFMEMVGFWLIFVVIYACFLYLYCKKGHPYKVILGENKCI